MRITRTIVLAAFSLFVLASAVQAQMQSIGVRPDLLRDVGIDQKLGSQVPPGVQFVDERGAMVTFGQYLGRGPVILALVYYQCPMLCTEVLNGLLNSVPQAGLLLGNDFRVIAVSIDPHDSVDEARAKWATYTGLDHQKGAASGWHFLTGQESAIHDLASSVGFRYAYDPASGQYAHPSAVIVLDTGGHISRYLPGASYSPRDLRLALVEASADKIGTPLDHAFLYCYHYDPHTGRYGLVIANVFRIAGLVTLLAIGAMIFALSRQTQRQTTRSPL
jgi:protein SCO1/2